MCDTSETDFWLLTSVLGMMWYRNLSIHSIRPCIGIELINDEFRFHIFMIRKVSLGWNALSECVQNTLLPDFRVSHLTCHSGGCDGSVISGVFQCSWQVFLLFPLVYWKTKEFSVNCNTDEIVWIPWICISSPNALSAVLWTCRTSLAHLSVSIPAVFSLLFDLVLQWKAL